MLEHCHKEPVGRTLTRQFFFHQRDGDSAVSMSNLCQFLVILRVKKVFPDAQRRPPMFHLCLLLLVLSLDSTGQKGGSAFFVFSLHVFVYFEIILSLLQAEQSQHSQPFLLRGMFQSLHDLYGLLLDCLQYISVSVVGASCQGPGACVCPVCWTVYSLTQSPFIILASVFKPVFCILGFAKFVFLVCTSWKRHGKISFEFAFLFQWK